MSFLGKAAGSAAKAAANPKNQRRFSKTMRAGRRAVNVQGSMGHGIIRIRWWKRKS